MGENGCGRKWLDKNLGYYHIKSTLKMAYSNTGEILLLHKPQRSCYSKVSGLELTWTMKKEPWKFRLSFQLRVLWERLHLLIKSLKVLTNFEFFSITKALLHWEIPFKLCHWPFLFWVYLGLSNRISYFPWVSPVFWLVNDLHQF